MARVVQCTVSVMSRLWLCYPAVTEMLPPRSSPVIGSPVTLSRLILSRRLTVSELRFSHVLWSYSFARASLSPGSIDLVTGSQ